nr:MFS transporter [Chloroflexota bacterium]
LFIFLIRKREPPPRREVQAGTGKRTSMRQEIMEGLRYVLSHPHLRAIAACTGSANLFSQLVFSILILYLARERSFEAERIGVAFSVGAVGFMVGALLANRLSARLGVGPTIIASAALSGPGLILIPLAPAGQELAFVAAAGFISSFNIAVYNITQVSYRQAITPERMQGRMNATMRFIVWGTIPVGAMAAGFLGGAIGLTQTIWIGVIGSMFVFLPVLLSPVRSLRKMPEPAPVPDEGEASPAIETLGDAIDESPRPVRGSPSPEEP